MNPLILHLSDIHIKDTSTLSSMMIDKIAGTVPESQIRRLLLLCVTGDIAFSGKAAEYDAALIAFNALTKLLQEKNYEVGVCVVPGNHDVEFIQEYGYSEIKHEIENHGKEQFLSLYLQQMENFYIFANEYELYDDNNMFCSKRIEIGSHSIEITMVNTVPFATMKKQDDKQLHFYPKRYFPCLQKEDNAEIKIVLSHYGEEWFDDDTKDSLMKELRENVDLLFVGHEHVDRSETILTVGQENLVVLRGGTLSADESNISTYKIYSIDFEKQRLVAKTYAWNRTANIFCETQCDKLLLSEKHPHQLIPVDSFFNHIRNRCNQFDMPISEIFAFPVLKQSFVSEEDGPEEDIETMDDLIDLALKNSLTCITGRANSGKTTLLQQLYLAAVDRGYSPLYLGQDNNTPSASKLFIDLVNEQYGNTDIARTKYSQVAASKKLLLIDDYDLLKRKGTDSSFFQTALEHVSHIIYISSSSPDLDLIESVRADLGDKNHVVTLAIKSPYKERRDNIIKKICQYKGMPHHAADTISINLDKLVGEHRQLCELNPDFVIQNTVYYLENSTAEWSEDLTFGLIYSNNIQRQIDHAHEKSYRHEKELLTKATSRILEVVAYTMHASKNDCITAADFDTLVRNFSDSSGIDLEPNAILHLAEKAGILKTLSSVNEIAFTSINYLAYFIAKRINTLANQGHNVTEDIDYLLKHVCFSINDAVLLFLSYLRDDTDFPFKLINEAEMALKDIEPFSLDRENVSFMSSRCDIPIRVIDEKSRQNNAKAMSIQEENFDTESLEYRKPYEYNTADARSMPLRLIRAIKYLEMIGKSYVVQFIDLSRDSKGELAYAMFEIADRIVYGILSPLDDEQIVETIYEEMRKSPDLPGVTKEKVRRAMYHFGLGIMIGLYDQFSFFSTKSYTCGTLIDNTYSGTTARIQKLQIASYGMNPDSFFDQAIRQFKEASNYNGFTEMVCIRIIVNLFILRHRNIQPGLIQKLFDCKMFNDKEKTRLISRGSK